MHTIHVTTIKWGCGFQASFPVSPHKPGNEARACTVLGNRSALSKQLDIPSLCPTCSQAFPTSQLLIVCGTLMLYVIGDREAPRTRLLSFCTGRGNTSGTRVRSEMWVRSGSVFDMMLPGNYQLYLDCTTFSNMPNMYTL